jgi:hypothetical protein
MKRLNLGVGLIGLRAFASFFQRDITVSLTVAYIMLILIGIVFSYVYYIQFGIHIVEYADITDFLLIPIIDPLTVLFFSLSLALYYLIVGIFDWIEAKYSTLIQWIYVGASAKLQGYVQQVFLVLFVPVYVFGVAYLYTYPIAYSIKQGFGTQIIVELQNKELPKHLHLPLFIGKNNGYVFLYYYPEHQTVIIPIENVGSITLQP